VYVDDALIAGKDEETCSRIKEILGMHFMIRDMKEAEYFLGIRIERDRKSSTVKISQSKYIERVVSSFGLDDAYGADIPMNPGMVLEAPIEGENMNTSNSFPYRELLGFLMYIAVTTTPNIMFSVSRLARYSTIASEMHWKAVKDVLRYLKRTSEFGLVYGGPSEITVVGYTDADWAGDRASRKSTSGYVFLVNKTVFPWKSSLQKVVSASSTEAEYISQALCTREALLVMKLKKDFEMDYGAVLLYGGKTRALTLA